MNTIENVTEKLASKTFDYWKNHLKHKFEILERDNTNNTFNTVKPMTLNLCNDDKPQHHKALLELGPKIRTNQSTDSIYGYHHKN